MSKRDGGPAFPGGPFFSKAVYEDMKPTEGVNRAREMATFSADGMTLRDYFAGQAIVGLVANPSWSEAWKTHAATAYEIADAMMDEREGGR